MARLIQFLMKLAADKFYGEVRIRFQAGRVHGQVEMTQAFLEHTLPEPDAASPAYQDVLTETVKGVNLSA